MDIEHYIKKAVEKYRTDGLFPLLHTSSIFAYKRSIRPYLPGRREEIRDIVIGGEERKVKPFDQLLGLRRPQNHKEANSELLTAHTSVGDDVIIVGGGFGITTVVAAREVGTSGRVVVYEGADKMITPLQETTKLNDVKNIVQIKHAIVGKDVLLAGPSESAEIISPSDLRCDVLEMDCEGAEIDIIEDLQTQPNMIIVETHPARGAPTQRVKERLEKRDYEIVEKKKDRNDGHILAASYIG